MGAGAVGVPDFLTQPRWKKKPGKGRVVNIGTVSVTGLTASSPAERVRQVLDIMQSMLPFNPDIICLPEGFAFAGLTTGYQVSEVAEKAPGPITSPFQEFARTHHCYIICPTYTIDRGNIFISAVLLDRQGKVIGEYHKIRPTIGEMETGVKPGKFDAPVFDTDFGKIGIQICFDIKYEEGWNALKEKGAEIIFWPSAYAAGREISARAWRHQVFIVTSTAKDTSMICDMSGETIAQTGRWQPNWACAPVNLEKTFILTWPAVSVFPDIQKKYGAKISLKSYHEEEWSIIESLDPDIRIADILKEFNLKPHYQAIREVAAVQDKVREK